MLLVHYLFPLHPFVVPKRVHMFSCLSSVESQLFHVCIISLQLLGIWFPDMPTSVSTLPRLDLRMQTWLMLSFCKMLWTLIKEVGELFATFAITRSTVKFRLMLVVSARTATIGLEFYFWFQLVRYVITSKKAMKSLFMHPLKIYWHHLRGMCVCVFEGLCVWRVGKKNEKGECGWIVYEILWCGCMCHVRKYEKCFSLSVCISIWNYAVSIFCVASVWPLNKLI